MRRLSVLLIFIILETGFSYGAEIEKYIVPCTFMIFVPSVENLVSTSKSLMKRFYSRNYEQMMLQMSSESKSSYGIDVFDLPALEKAGVDIKSPLCFVHVTNERGYLLIPVKSKKGIDAFIKNSLKNYGQYRFIGNYIALSKDKEELDGIAKETLEEREGFNISAKKLSFAWDRNFIWMESSFISGASYSIGVTSNLKLPYGFTAFTIDVTDRMISVKSFAGILPSKEVLNMVNLRNVSMAEKFDLLDYTVGDPALAGQVYLNFPMFYKYYTYIDSIDILGIKSLVSELRDKYKVFVERDLIQNTDGRFKIVIDKFDTSKNDYVLYGSIGIKDPKTAGYFMDSLKNAILQTDNQLFTFDLFTNPFYHFKSSGYSLFYGVIGNDLFFSTDKDVLTNLVKNIFDNNMASADKYPGFFKEARQKKAAGFYFTLDVQSLFNQVKTDVDINKDILIGFKDIYISGYPDSGAKAYGWNCAFDFNFYK